MISLGIESGGERQHCGRTKLDAETATLASLHVDGDVAFCHSV
jgi:hypothetical protein